VSAPTNPEGYGAAEVAEADQLIAQAREDVELLLTAMRGLVVKRGELQAVCDMAAYISHEYTSDHTVALLAVALDRMAREVTSQ